MRRGSVYLGGLLVCVMPLSQFLFGGGPFPWGWIIAASLGVAFFQFVAPKGRKRVALDTEGVRFGNRFYPYDRLTHAERRYLLGAEFTQIRISARGMGKLKLPELENGSEFLQCLSQQAPDLAVQDRVRG